MSSSEELYVQHGEAETLLSLLHQLAERSPDSDFLVETKSASLTYRQAYLLASNLLPDHVRHLCPSLASPRRSKVVIISPNNVLFPLALWTFWFMSITVVPLAVNAEQSLWESMVQLIDPDAVIISRHLHDSVASQLHSNPQHQSWPIICLEDLIPGQFHVTISRSRKSDFVPSLLKWLSSSDIGPEPGELVPPPSVKVSDPVISLFTSSAVDASSLKCVTYTHSMLVRSGCRAIEMLGGAEYGTRPIRHLGWLPLSHCFEFCITLVGTVLRTGGAYIAFDGQVSSPDLPLSTPLATLLLDAIRYHQPVDAFCTVPAIFSEIKKQCSPGDLTLLRSMRSLGVGGAPTPEEIFQWAAEEGIAYFDCSGATEAAGTICIRRALVPSMREHGLQMIPGLEGLLEKEHPDDRFGELIVRATHLPASYENVTLPAYSYDARTGVTTYRTGDLYEHRLKDQQKCVSYVRGEDVPPFDLTDQPLSGLAYMGRLDDLVVLASGVKIDALTLERSLNDHPDIIRSAVIADIERSAPVVLIQPVFASGSKLTSEKRTELVAFALQLNHSLSFEKRIRSEKVFLVDQLPSTTKFTLNRKKVKKIWAETRGNWPGIISSSDDVNPLAAAGDNIRVPEISPELRLKIESLLSELFSIPVERFSRGSIRFSDIPLTSLSSVQLAKSLEVQFDIRISASQLYALHTVDDICRLVAGGFTSVEDGRASPSPSSKSDPSAWTRVADPFDFMDESFVISGVSCRFPGDIASLSDLWSNLLNPESYLARLDKSPPSSRWPSFSVSADDLPPMAWLSEDNFNNLDSFREFFNLSPADAEAMSPNARLVMQLGYQAIEDAGIAPSTLAGKPWGIFSSVNNSGWRERRAAEMELNQYALALEGSADDAVGGRLSYYLDLTGPAVEIKTACSSSAVALHYACQAIRNGDCDAAIVIASTTHFHPSGPMFRAKAGIASRNGRCATFCDSADGFLPSEGAAAVVIQKAADVRSPVYGKIRATHVTQDGRSHGFFAPNPSAQKRLLEGIYKKANCSVDDIDYLETHGTGTHIGDAIEMQAINACFGGKRTRPLYTGAVKAVLGHTEECAGLTGVLKSLMCLQENAIPPQPYFTYPNQELDLGISKVVIPKRIRAFVRGKEPRLIGVSSFGLSGTLAHILIEDFDSVAPTPLAPPLPLVFLVSASREAEYESLLHRYLDYTYSPSASEVPFDSICRTSQSGRDHHALRRAFVVPDLHSLSRELAEEIRTPSPWRAPGNVRVGLWFGLPLSERLPTKFNSPLFDRQNALCTKAGWAPEFEFFRRQLVLANVLRTLGCQVTAVGGEGVAELVAAVYAGIIPITSVFQDGVQIPGDAGRGLFSVRCTKDAILEHMAEWTRAELCLRGQHGAELFTLEGDISAAEELARSAQLELRSHRLAATDRACTSILPSHLSHLSTRQPNPTIPFVSGYLGEVLDKDVLANAAYWNQVHERYVDCPQAWSALASQCDMVISLGGANDIEAHLKDSIAYDGGEFESLLGRLYEFGCDLDWNLFGSDGLKTHIPAYNWVGSRY